MEEAFCPGEMEKRSICIDGDIGEILDACRLETVYYARQCGEAVISGKGAKPEP